MHFARLWPNHSFSSSATRKFCFPYRTNNKLVITILSYICIMSHEQKLYINYSIIYMYKILNGLILHILSPLDAFLLCFEDRKLTFSWRVEKVSILVYCSIFCRFFVINQEHYFTLSRIFNTVSQQPVSNAFPRLLIILLLSFFLISSNSIHNPLDSWLFSAYLHKVQHDFMTYH